MDSIAKLKKDYNFSESAIEDIVREIAMRTDDRDEIYLSLSENLPECEMCDLPNFVKSRVKASLPSSVELLGNDKKYKFSKDGFRLFNELYEITKDIGLSESLTQECYSMKGNIIPEFAVIVKIYTDEHGTNKHKLAYIMNQCGVNSNKVNKNAVNRLESLKFIRKDLLVDAMNVLKGKDNDYPQECFDVFKANYDPNDPEKAIYLFSASGDDKNNFCKNIFDFGKRLLDEGLDINTVCMYMNASKEGNTVIKEKYTAAKELFEMGVETKSISSLVNLCCKNPNNYNETHFNQNLLAAKKLFKTEGKNTLEILEKCMDIHGKFDEERYNSFKHVLAEAIKKRDTFKVANEYLSDEDMTKYFLENFDEFMKTVDIIGEKAFFHAFKYKKDGLFAFASRVSRKFTLDMTEKFAQIANPEKSEKYKSLTFLIDDLKKDFSKLKTPIQLQAETEYNKKLNSLEAEKSRLKTNLYNYDKFAGEKIKRLNNEIKEIKYKIKLLQPKNPELIDKISKLSKERSEILQNALTDPLAIVNIANIFCALSFSPEKLNELYPFMTPKTEMQKQLLNEKLNKMIFDLIDVQYDENVSKTLNLASSRYLSELFSSNSTFLNNFKKLVILLKQTPDLSVKEILNNLEQNKVTKKQFENYGINYDKWVEADKNSFVSVFVELNSQKAKQNVIENIIKDFNDPLWNDIPEEEVIKIKNDLQEKGFKIKNMIILFENTCLSFEKIPKLISAIKESLNKNEFWSKTSDDRNIENARSTISNHLLKLRSIEAENAQNLKNDEDVTLEVHKTDMNNISHALFLGNHSQCCTAAGTGCNQWTAPLYIKNKMISGIEIMDGTEFVGNTMCWFALVDGKPALVLDNIELSNKYQYNDKIKDAIFEYSQKILDETGCSDFNIYAGPKRHKLNMNNLEFELHNMIPIGSTGEDAIYMDYDTDAHRIDGKTSDNVKLYKIK